MVFRIFNAKKTEKDELYQDLLTLSNMVVGQVEKGIQKVKGSNSAAIETLNWLDQINHYRNIMLMVIDQTERRVIDEEDVPSNEKVVSFFELHTDIIVKDKREFQYGHKINVASDSRGLLTHVSVEEGNAMGVKQVVFHKKRGVNLNDMGVKQKKYNTLKNFRAGVEGNISELKRAFGLRKALWKGYEGFHAYVWASAITYNLIRIVRIHSD